MPIEGFDYKAFANDLASQAIEILRQPGSNAVPDLITDSDKKNITDTVRKFCFMAGEALSNDPQLKFTAEQAILVTQFIGEWTFHKSIDLIKGKVPVQYRNNILQVIASNIFSTTKLAIIKNMPQDALISLVEEKVKAVYSSELQKIVTKGEMSQKQFEQAVNMSNLNDLVQKTEDQEKLKQAQLSESESKTPADKKVLKLAALAIVLKRLSQDKVDEILNGLDKTDVQHVINYMKMSDLENKIDHKVLIKSLEEIKKVIPEPQKVNTDMVLKRHRKLIKSTPVDLLSKIALKEREYVQDFILDLKFPAEEVFSPMVLQSLAKCIEDKLNDN